jgi:origin recognition complex subunit 1
MNGLINGGSSTSMYISGMPGTGKTATTLEIIKDLKYRSRVLEELPPFKFIKINGMSLNNPHLVYSILYEKITGKMTTPATAAIALDEFFKKRAKIRPQAAKKKAIHKDSKKEDRVKLVLIDELDALLTKKQTLLYNLFDWPSYENSGLLIIAIANTMDLPEKMQ